MTANPLSSHPVKIIVSGVTSGTVVKIYNYDTGNGETIKFGASSPISYDLANLPGGYTSGNDVRFSIHGKNEGSKTYTVSGGTGEVTVTVAASATPGVII